MNRYSLTFAAIALSVATATAQIAFGGEPISLKAQKLQLPAAARATMPTVDAQALMAEDAERAALGIKGPFRFGFNHTTDLSMVNSGTWSDLPDGTRLWRLRIECPGALSINFLLGEYVVPEGARVFVQNDAGAWLGAFTQASSGGELLMGVSQLAGDAITVSYEAPATIADQGVLRITQVTHAYRDVLGLMKGLGDSGACNNNVICPVGDDWRDEIASVAMITVGGSGICTGTLINNCAQDGTPYFLTADHCTGGGTSGWTFRFNWDSPQCASNLNGPTNQTVSGCSLLASSGGSDVALLQLNSTPPPTYNVYYAGWDVSGTAPTSSVAIHHPSGDVKKISFENNPSTTGSFGGAQCWHIAAWDDGTTEPGSSGSGLWNQDHRLIGQLYGGQANCSNNVNDYYGRLDVSYPLLDEWLGNCGTVLDGWDPNGTPDGLDAALQSLSGIDDSYCGSNTINPSVVLKNNGAETITSVTYTWDLDNGTPTANTWNGNLLAGETTTLNLGPITVPTNGNHVFNVSCSSPNGGDDTNPGNDDRQKQFYVANPGVAVDVAITLDDYGTEITWSVADDGGNVLFTGGPYADDANGTVESASVCLTGGCFIFTISDSYGDGICCQYGDGDYAVSANGTVLIDGNGTFTDEVATNFCVGSDAVPNSTTQNELGVFPNPSNGLVNVMLPVGQTGILRVMDAQGRLVWNARAASSGVATIDLGSIAAGRYTLQCITPVGTLVQAITIIR